jgi:hypothetical protein
MDGLAIAALVVSIVAIILVLLIFVWWYRKEKKTEKKREKPMSIYSMYATGVPSNEPNMVADSEMTQKAVNSLMTRSLGENVAPLQDPYDPMPMENFDQQPYNPDMDYKDDGDVGGMAQALYDMDHREERNLIET